MRMKIFTSIFILAASVLANFAHSDEGYCYGISQSDASFCQKLEGDACQEDPLCTWIASDGSQFEVQPN